MTDLTIYLYRREHLKDELLAVINDTAGQPYITEESLSAFKEIIGQFDYIDREIEWQKKWQAEREAEKKGSLEDDKSLKAKV